MENETIIAAVIGVIGLLLVASINIFRFRNRLIFSTAAIVVCFAVILILWRVGNGSTGSKSTKEPVNQSDLAGPENLRSVKIETGRSGRPQESAATPAPAPVATDCAASMAERIINREVKVSEFLDSESWFRVDKLPSVFASANEFFHWLSRKPRLVIGAEGRLIFDAPVKIAACEVVLQEGALVMSREHDIRLLTLNMINQGGVIRTTPAPLPDRGRASSGHNARHHDRRYRECDCCAPTEHGQEGGRGKRGDAGLPGVPAAGVILMSASINGSLHVEAIGGRGGKGGDGGHGGNGGHGRGASEGESDFLDAFCKCGGHDGGRGGRGGDGGMGGNGGDGGMGGQVLIITTDALPRESLTLLNHGGDGGEGGQGGIGGKPGEGGHGGDGNASCRTLRPGGKGDKGHNGTLGDMGKKGPDGPGKEIERLRQGGEPLFGRFWQRVVREVEG